MTRTETFPIAYETHGEGTTALVFVHGWSCDRRYWKEQVPLSRDFKIVTIDLAGHGETELEHEEWTIAGLGNDVAAVVERLGLDRVVLIGHSMGGDVILEAARRLRGRVAGLVWVDVYRTILGPWTPEGIDAFQAPFRANFQARTREFVRGMFPPATDPSLADWVVEDMSSADPEIALPVMKATFNFRGEVPGALAELKLPVVAINPSSPPGDIPSMERHGVEVMLMADVGHFPMLEAPERFNSVLREAVGRFVK